MNRTPGQNIRLHKLLHKLGIDKDTKAELVMQFSNGRTSHSSELYIQECRALISALESGTPSPVKDESRKATILEKTRWRLIYTFRDKGMVLEGNKPDMDRINQYTEHYWKKRVFEMTLEEANTYIGIVKKWRKKNA